eukprot:8863353-Alexandrium_andersonii.AAC.1
MRRATCVACVQWRARRRTAHSRHEVGHRRRWKDFLATQLAASASCATSQVALTATLRPGPAPRPPGRAAATS